MPAVGMRHSRHAAAARSIAALLPAPPPAAQQRTAVHANAALWPSRSRRGCVHPAALRTEPHGFACGGFGSPRCSARVSATCGSTILHAAIAVSDRTPSAPSGVCNRRLGNAALCLLRVRVDNAMPRGAGRIAHRPPHPGAHAAAVPRPPRYLPPACRRAPPQTTRFSMVMVRRIAPNICPY